MATRVVQLQYDIVLYKPAAGLHPLLSWECVNSRVDAPASKPLNCHTSVGESRIKPTPDRGESAYILQLHR